MRVAFKKRQECRVVLNVMYTKYCTWMWTGFEVEVELVGVFAGCLAAVEHASKLRHGPDFLFLHAASINHQLFPAGTQHKLYTHSKARNSYMYYTSKLATLIQQTKCEKRHYELQKTNCLRFSQYLRLHHTVIAARSTCVPSSAGHVSVYGPGPEKFTYGLWGSRLLKYAYFSHHDSSCKQRENVCFLTAMLTI